MTQIGISPLRCAGIPSPSRARPRTGHQALVNDDPVNYRHIVYEPPPQSSNLSNRLTERQDRGVVEFVKPGRHVDGPPEPKAPPTAENCPLPSGLVVKASCIIGGFVTTGWDGRHARSRVRDGGFATGGSLMGVGVIVIVAGICWPYR